MSTENVESAGVIVAGHICLDIIPTFPDEINVEDVFVPGKLTNVEGAVTSTGGAVSNTGLALHRLGTPTALMGKVGDDMFGKAVMDILHERDPRLAEGMIVSEGENTSYTVVLNPPGVDRMFLHCPGANDTFSSDDVSVNVVQGAELFHFGYPPLMRSFYNDEGDELAELFNRVKNAGLITSLDMSLPDPNSESGRVDWERLLSKTLPYVDIFLPSFDEILYMLKRRRFDAGEGSSPTPELVQEVSELLLEMGAEIVGLKLGAGGLYLRTGADAAHVLTRCCGNDHAGFPEWESREMYTPCFDTEAIGATGAGDCTIAGFLMGVQKGMGPEATLNAASAVGACNVEASDATSGIPCWEKINERLEAGWQKKGPLLSFDDWRRSNGENVLVGPRE